MGKEPGQERTHGSIDKICSLARARTLSFCGRQEDDFAAHVLPRPAIHQRGTARDVEIDGGGNGEPETDFVQTVPDLLEADLPLARIPHGPCRDDGDAGERGHDVTEEILLQLLVLRLQLRNIFE